MPADPRDIPLALYVHIPWCERKCPYCDFNSHEQFSPALEPDYVNALINDLDTQSAELDTSRPLVSVFIGGGTPSLFSADSIGRLMTAVDRQFTLANDVEITLESNPGSAEADRFLGYRAAGINRVSLGVQSFHDESLRVLGRVHSARQARRAAEMASTIFARFNLDLMHGLPGQTAAMAAADLSAAISLGGQHLSWYQLTVEPNTQFWSHPPEIPQEAVLADAQSLGEALLADAGFEQYEVSAWASGKHASRHNINYWEFGDYMGIGAGAHGKLTRADGSIVRTRRTRLPRDYMAGITEGKAPITGAIDVDDLAGEFMMNALRLKGGVTLSSFATRTGLAPATLSPAIGRLQGQGLLAKDMNRLRTTEVGYRYLDTVVGHFFGGEA